MSLVDSFCIDRYEAYLVTMDQPSQPGQPVSPFGPPSAAHRYAARSAAGATPQGYISRNDAAEACRNAGKRLCGAQQWHKACGGTQGTRYPYGSKEVRGRCNTGKLYLPTKLFGSIPLSSVDLNNPKLNQEPGGLAKSGEYAECVNDYGLFDMVGNLHEWVADESNSALSKKIPIPYGQGRMGPRGSGVFMGGFFSSMSEHGHGCNYVTTHHAPDYHDYSTGFRCCAEPVRKGDSNR
jgi:formylglycine-generating enzyme